MPVFAAWLLNFFLSLLVSVLALMFSDVILSFIGQFLDLAVGAVNAANVASLPTVSQAISALPLDMLVIMKRVHLDSCLSILSTAYSVRFAGSVFGIIRGLRGQS